MAKPCAPMSSEIPAPRMTSSCSLFLMTILVLVAIVVVYYSWYRQPLGKTSKHFTECKVAPEDDLQRCINQAQPRTILLLEASRREGAYQVIGKKELTIKSVTNAKVVITGQGPLFRFENCRACSLEGLQLVSDSSQNPVVCVVNSHGIGIKKNHLQGAVGIKIHAQPTEISLTNNQLKITQCGILVQDAKTIYCQGNQISLDQTTKIQDRTAIKCKQVTGLQLKGNHCTSGTILLERIQASNSDQPCVISNNQVQTSQGPVMMIQAGQGLLLQNNQLTSKGGVALWLQNSRDIMACQNKIKSMAGSALLITGGRNLKFVENDFLNALKNKRVVIVRNLQDASFLKNKIYGYPRRDHKKGQIQERRGGGILIEWCKGLKITGNQILYSDSYGLRMHKESDGNELRENLIKDNSTHGVEITHCNHFIVAKNTLQGNYDGLRIQASQGQVIANLITHNRSNGIWIEGGKPLILKNRILQNESHGIECIACQPEIKNNTFSGNKGFGITYSQHIEQPPLPPLNEFKDNGRGMINNP